MNVLRKNTDQQTDEYPEKEKRKSREKKRRKVKLHLVEGSSQQRNRIKTVISPITNTGESSVILLRFTFFPLFRGSYLYILYRKLPDHTNLPFRALSNVFYVYLFAK